MREKKIIDVAAVVVVAVAVAVAVVVVVEKNEL